MSELDYTDQRAATLEPTRVVVYKQIGGRELRLNIFDPPGLAAGDRRPCLLTIHGGGWTGMAPRRMYPAAAHFASRGLVGVAAEYRLAADGSGTTVSDCVKDARSAARYLRSHAAELGLDPQKLIAHGGSAGGHLAAGTALFDGVDEASDDTTVSCVPNALVLLFPVIDTSADGYGRSLLGDRWRDLSPLHQVRPGTPPTLILHGTGDTVTPFSGAVAFRDAMRRVGNHCELVPHDGGAHGYLMHDGALFEQALAQIEGFLGPLGLMA